MTCFLYTRKEKELENDVAKPFLPGSVLFIAKVTKFPREVLEYAMFSVPITGN